jgi:hypothetical protein
MASPAASSHLPILAEPGDRFAVKSLSGLALARQRSRARVKARHELLEQGYTTTVTSRHLHYTCASFMFAHAASPKAREIGVTRQRFLAGVRE